LRKLLSLVFVLLIASSSFAAIPGLNSDVKSALVKMGSDVVVSEGTIVESAVSVGGDVLVKGTVQKDVVSVGGDVVLGKTAVVNGDVVLIGGKLTKDPSSKISGDIVELGMTSLPGAVIGKSMVWGFPLMGLLSFISFLVLAAFAVVFFPLQIGRVSYKSERSAGSSFFWGVLMMMLVIPIIMLLAISLIGIAFIPAYLIILAAAVFFGYVAIAQLVGKKIMKALRLYNKPMMIETIFGMVLLAIIGLIPFVGWLIKVIIATIGLGAVASTRFGIYY